jgi:hypothetical protein
MGAVPVREVVLEPLGEAFLAGETDIVRAVVAI